MDLILFVTTTNYFLFNDDWEFMWISGVTQGN